jgi:hypothetical protein
MACHLISHILSSPNKNPLPSKQKNPPKTNPPTVTSSKFHLSLGEQSGWEFPFFFGSSNAKPEAGFRVRDTAEKGNSAPGARVL